MVAAGRRDLARQHYTLANSEFDKALKAYERQELKSKHNGEHSKADEYRSLVEQSHQDRAKFLHNFATYLDISNKADHGFMNGNRYHVGPIQSGSDGPGQGQGQRQEAAHHRHGRR